MEHDKIQEGKKYYTTKALEAEIEIPINTQVIAEKKSRAGNVNIQVKAIALDFSFWMDSEDLSEESIKKEQKSKKKKEF